jgi:PAS domain-containing protein
MEKLSDQLVRDLLNAAPDPTIIIDASGEIVFASSHI